MRIAVICRGSVATGLGHLYRAFSFAKAAESMHDVAVFAEADPTFASIFSALSRPALLAEKEGSWIAPLRSFAPEAIVFDLTSMSHAHFAACRQTADTLISISPVFDQARHVDLFFTRGQHPAGLTGPLVFAGLPYAIINAHCVPISNARFDEAAEATPLSVMVSFGGADADNHTRLTLEVLREVSRPLLIWAMLGDAYRFSHDELVDTMRTIPHHEIILARTNRSMWAVAGNCALAVLSSGQSTLEAIYAGIPIISVIRQNDPSQQVNNEYDSLCLNGGSFCDGSFRRISRLVEALYDDRPRLHAMRHARHSLLDGRGADRVLAEIVRFAAARRRVCAS